MQNKLATSIQVMAAVVIVFVLLYLFSTTSDGRKEQKIYEELADMYTRFIPDSPDYERYTFNPDKQSGNNVNRLSRLNVDFDSLAVINDEISGWLYIEGLPVNYPVVQTSDNSYYLSRSFERELSNLGTLFFDNSINPDESDVLFIYGHNMGYGRKEMFSALSKYDSYNFWNQHKEIITVALSGNEVIWNIFAVLHINVDIDDTDIYTVMNFYDEKKYNEYIQLISTKALYHTGFIPEARQKLLVLSTCLGNGRNEMRRMVFAYAAE